MSSRLDMEDLEVKRLLVGCLVPLLLAGAANATVQLHIPSFAAGGAQLSCRVETSTQTLSRNFYSGRFNWNLNTGSGWQSQVMPMYCLDVFHSFSFGQYWTVNPIVVPPSPNPPFSTADAVWVFYHYGWTMDATQAQAVQLALWEITHERDTLAGALGWRARWSGGWGAGGDFQYTGSASNASYTKATEILTDCYANSDPENPQYLGMYYQPVSASLGQGQLTGIPEPGTLVLLGVGLLSVGGACWRRRRGQ